MGFHERVCRFCVLTCSIAKSAQAIHQLYTTGFIADGAAAMKDTHSTFY
jgi:hypothetical protein